MIEIKNECPECGSIMIRLSSQRYRCEQCDKNWSQRLGLTGWMRWDSGKHKTVELPLFHLAPLNRKTVPEECTCCHFCHKDSGVVYYACGRCVDKILALDYHALTVTDIEGLADKMLEITKRCLKFSRVELINDLTAKAEYITAINTVLKRTDIGR